MRIREWLEAERGRTKMLADHFSVTPSAVSQWLTNGVPMKHIVAVRDFTGGTVTIEEMLQRPQHEPAAPTERVA